MTFSIYICDVMELAIPSEVYCWTKKGRLWKKPHSWRNIGLNAGWVPADYLSLKNRKKETKKWTWLSAVALATGTRYGTDHLLKPASKDLLNVNKKRGCLARDILVHIYNTYMRVLTERYYSSSNFLASTNCAIPLATCLASFMAKTTVCGVWTTSPPAKTPFFVVMP